jgi:DNA-binding MarR family transcriptional regulator
MKIQKNAPTRADEGDSDSIPLLVADIFHLAGAFRSVGEQIASTLGQTQARWQVLSAASADPRTVAQIARRLGFARQSVQRTADQLVRNRLARYSPNPDHKNSPLLELTEEGLAVLKQITRQARKLHLTLARQLDSRELSITLKVLRQLCAAVDPRTRI